MQFSDPSKDALRILMKGVPFAVPSNPVSGILHWQDDRCVSSLNLASMFNAYQEMPAIDHRHRRSNLYFNFAHHREKLDKDFAL
jgi:hypothetical protein